MAVEPFRHGLAPRYRPRTRGVNDNRRAPEKLHEGRMRAWHRLPLDYFHGRKPSIGYDPEYKPVVRAVEEYLKGKLKDPDSLRFVEFTNPSTREVDGQKGWIVVEKYRAKNSFGGYVIEEEIALIRDERVVIWKTPGR